MSIIARLQPSRRIQALVARCGVNLIAASRIADGYWRPWRGSFFNHAQSKGLHILPVHYYTPIPDTRALENNQTPLYAHHIEYNATAALAVLREHTQIYGSKFEEIRRRRDDGTVRYIPDNSAYHPGEAETLYSIVRSTQPKRIIEIGCGISTLLISEALADAKHDDSTHACQYTCVEPFRPQYLQDPPPEVTEFRDQPVQKLSPDDVRELEAGDILFIDSTHVICTQSDVLHEVLTLLPSLKPGVLVHVHDIFLPYDYPQEWMHGTRFYWAEQYLLYAYLIANSGIEVFLPMHLLARQHHDEMVRLFPGIETAKMPPSAMWLRIKEA